MYEDGRVDVIDADGDIITYQVVEIPGAGFVAQNSYIEDEDVGEIVEQGDLATDQFTFAIDPDEGLVVEDFVFEAFDDEVFEEFIEDVLASEIGEEIIFPEDGFLEDIIEIIFEEPEPLPPAVDIAQNLEEPFVLKLASYETTGVWQDDYPNDAILNSTTLARIGYFGDLWFLEETGFEPVDLSDLDDPETDEVETNPIIGETESGNTTLTFVWEDEFDLSDGEYVEQEIHLTLELSDDGDAVVAASAVGYQSERMSEDDGVIDDVLVPSPEEEPPVDEGEGPGQDGPIAVAIARIDDAAFTETLSFDVLPPAELEFADKTVTVTAVEGEEIFEYGEWEIDLDLPEVGDLAMAYTGLGSFVLITDSYDDDDSYDEYDDYSDISSYAMYENAAGEFVGFDRDYFWLEDSATGEVGDLASILLLQQQVTLMPSADGLITGVLAAYVVDQATHEATDEMAYSISFEMRGVDEAFLEALWAKGDEPLAAYRTEHISSARSSHRRYLRLASASFLCLKAW